jgi:hypothetical protein
MIFIFDWGHQTFKEIGPLSKTDFKTSLEPEMAWLVMRRSWFRAFFIPTIPTETEYGLVDENGDFFKIEKATFEQYVPLAKLNAAISKDEISCEEYERRRNEMGF